MSAWINQFQGNKCERFVSYLRKHFFSCLQLQFLLFVSLFDEFMQWKFQMIANQRICVMLLKRQISLLLSLVLLLPCSCFFFSTCLQSCQTKWVLQSIFSFFDNSTNYYGNDFTYRHIYAENVSMQDKKKYNQNQEQKINVYFRVKIRHEYLIGLKFGHKPDFFLCPFLLNIFLCVCVCKCFFRIRPMKKKKTQ